MEGVRKCVLDAVFNAQGYGCAPGVIGVCIGGDRASGYEEAKLQLLREIGGTSNDRKMRAFEKRHGARIFVGEFSAIVYAKGCDRWIADVGALLNEYGWDWCYHAFREWPGWSVEHCVTSGDSAATAKFAPSADNPRRRALLAALRKSDR